MAIQHSLWTVSPIPQLLPSAVLPDEKSLESMIVAAPQILSDEWMLIGRQERTAYGGIIDLLAITPDGALVLIELKRDQTPREVVAQAIDYAAWVETLASDAIAAIYKRFKPAGDLATDFKQRFGQDLDEETLNQAHQIIIAAASLDAATERIVGYLNQRDIAINVICFQVFGFDGRQFLSRSWLLDPEEIAVATPTPARGPKEPWDGEFYVSYGELGERLWSDALRFGFICAGGGRWYSKTLHLLSPGDRIWVNVPSRGYVGVGRVTAAALPAADFRIVDEEGTSRSALDVLTGAAYHRDFVADLEKCEYFVGVDWLDTVQVAAGLKEVGLFGNQATVCRPTTLKWRHTIERLKAKFPNFNAHATGTS